MDLGLRDHVYVVTGGTRGLGRATAEVLVAEGARVVVSGTDAGRVRAAQHELGEESAVAMTGDNGDPAVAGLLVEAARDRWGRLDGALVSVGGPPPGSVMATSDAEWTAAFESVFLGAVRIARTVAQRVTGPASIAFVLSTSVRAPLAGLAVSNGLRPGLAMVAKTLADELGPRAIRVNGLLPGRVATDRVRDLDDATGDAEAARAASSASIPLRRYGRPEEFAAVAAFLLSPASSYVSGSMVAVDGGLVRAL